MLFSCKTSIKDFKVCSFSLIESWHNKSSKFLHRYNLLKVLFALNSTHVLAFQTSLSPSSSTCTLYQRFENLHLPSREFRRTWSFPDTNTALENTTRFSRFQLNGWVLFFFDTNGCKTWPVYSEWTNQIETLRIISNDFEIRFPHVTLSRNFRTAFTHSLFVSSINTQNNLVVNFGVETTYRQNCQGYTVGNLKHIARYVGRRRSGRRRLVARRHFSFSFLSHAM